MGSREREIYGFDSTTKLDILRRDNFSCVNCGKHKSETEEGYVEIHHRLPIWFVANFLPEAAPALISSMANGECLCVPCHHEVHSTETTEAYIELAAQLFDIKASR